MRIIWQPLLVFCLVLVAGAALSLQRQANDELRAEIELQRDRRGELLRLRSDHDPLVRAQILPAELAALRADHAAVQRLQTEVELMTTRVREMEAMTAR